MALATVADFYAEVMGRLRGLGLDTQIWTMPVEIEGAIPFDQDREHASYDRDYVNRFWRILVQADRVFTLFRSSFLGKASPVHFFWGSFDLAVTRFSGRPAPTLTSASPHLGAWVMREAYSHEVSSCGFWPGNGGYRRGGVLQLRLSRAARFRRRADPAGGHITTTRASGSSFCRITRSAKRHRPDETLLEYLRSTYAAAADLAHWDRSALERSAAVR